MPESRRSDPLGWFASACFTILAAAIALHVAVALVRGIWTWLLLGIGTVMTVVVVVRLLTWLHRRQQW